MQRKTPRFAHQFLKLTFGTFISLWCLAQFAPTAHAVADKQSFFGAGLGFEVLSSSGSGTGWYFQGEGGYAFSENFALGLQAGYSHVGNLNIKMLDFGPFAQLTDPSSGIYGKVLLSGVNAATDSGRLEHGVDGTELGFAPGIGLGLLIPPLGDLHMEPELNYRLAFLSSKVNLITAVFKLVWDY